MARNLDGTGDFLRNPRAAGSGKIAADTVDPIYFRIIRTIDAAEERTWNWHQAAGFAPERNHRITNISTRNLHRAGKSRRIRGRWSRGTARSYSNLRADGFESARVTDDYDLSPVFMTKPITSVA